uniref:Rho GTPase activating protein n=1 Tax=Timema monikensis TaxID=170555 RepID=A0A7R9EC70_9NEOP|nr:unnamed protein product [Timema monikensis]
MSVVCLQADATVVMEHRHFVQASLQYVFLLQEVQERKKFEFVETLLGFMYGWLTFYHQGHEVANEFKPYMRELQLKLQKVNSYTRQEQDGSVIGMSGPYSCASDQDTAVGEEKHAHDETNQDEHHHSKKHEDQKVETRDNFNATRDITESYMRKMLEVRPMKSSESGSPHRNSDREGYLFLMEKKAFGTTWTKQYCTYHKNSKEFRMIPYNQMTGKFSSAESFTLASCVRRMSDSIEKRFCFDITSVERPGVVAVQYTLQALSEEDRKQWMDIMDGKEPVSEGLQASALHGMYALPGKILKPEERALDEIGIGFVNRCIEVLESRGLEEQGLYRVAGVSSKVTKLVSMGLDRRKSDKMTMLDDSYEWDSKTITSALKTYLRNLPEPLMTFRYHNGFIAAAKLESRSQRVNNVHTLIHRLPQQNMEVLDILLRHLNNVASKSDRNLMTVSNLGVCFGPTLLRPEEETVAAIMDIKFCNIVVEILIENYDKIFKTKPEQMELSRPENQTSPQSLALGMNHVGSSPPPPSHPRKMHYGTGSQPITHVSLLLCLDRPRINTMWISISASMTAWSKASLSQ